MKHYSVILAALILSACGAGTDPAYHNSAPAATPVPQQKSAAAPAPVTQAAKIDPNAGTPENFIISAGGLTLKTCRHDAHATCSVSLRGKEYIDDHDHGRQLQSAVTNGIGERYNPTEAGAAFWYDGINPNPSSSVMEHGVVIENTLHTVVRMAYWNPVNGVRVSENKVRKDVKIGAFGLPNVIDYRVTFYRPAEEKWTFGQYEALTGYMPPDFNTFYTLDLANRARYAEPLADGNEQIGYEQHKPVIMCTEDSQHCMGIYSPQLPQERYKNEAGYGRWRFKNEKVVKWNAVFRFDNPAAYQVFQLYVLVGTQDEVIMQMRQLHNVVRNLY